MPAPKPAVAAKPGGPPPKPAPPPNFSAKHETAVTHPPREAATEPKIEKLTPKEELTAMAADLTRLGRLVPTRNVADTDVYGKELLQHAARLTAIAKTL